MALESPRAAGASGDAKLVIFPGLPANALPNAEPDPRAPKPEVEAPLRAKGEAADVELKAELAKGEAVVFGLLVAKGEAVEFALFKAKGDPAEAFPKALAVKACYN